MLNSELRRKIRSGVGAFILPDNQCFFRVWAPRSEKVELHLLGPEERLLEMKKERHGYRVALVENVAPGQQYFYRLNGKADRPDPASRCQPEGVHGPSAVTDTGFDWRDFGWAGIPLNRHVFYELHVGTYTPEGTFEAIIPHLDTLKELGVTAVELMPVSQFPGERNWGYDGAYPYAPQYSYGGATGLKKLVDAAHRKGMAVILDVVYNHLGPEGNYLEEFGPYFNDCYKTPWGQAVNYDGALSDEVRNFFIGNAVYWIEEFHIDGLRLDATHFMFDNTAFHVLAEMEMRCRQAGERVNRRVHLFAETDANDVRWLRPPEMGGYGFDAQWLDDFQHALVTLLPGADAKAYMDDYGDFRQLAKAYHQGFVYSGEYSPFRRRRHGSSSRFLPGQKFVVFLQNHDQVGNRPLGDRLSAQVSFETLKLAAGAVILSPYLPMLFMGEEYAESAPFLYFVSHSDVPLIEAVRKGRREEFAHFLGDAEPPDPQAGETFHRSKLDHSLRLQEPHRTLWQFNRELLRLRRELPPLFNLEKENLKLDALEEERVICMHRAADGEEVLVILCLNSRGVEAAVPVPRGHWEKILDSAEEKWRGEGSLVPSLVESSGRPTSLSLPPVSVLVFAKTRVSAGTEF